MNYGEFDAKESRFREKMLEHLFLAEALQFAYRRQEPVGVLRTEVDRAGYDLALEYGEVTRYIQLKGSSARTRSPRPPAVSSKLANIRGACVVWMWIKNEDLSDKEHVKIEYRLLAGNANEYPKLGSTPGKRHGTVVPSKTDFTKMDISDLIATLLGISKIIQDV